MIRRPPRSTLSLHDALPISSLASVEAPDAGVLPPTTYILPPWEWTPASCRAVGIAVLGDQELLGIDRKSTRLNSSHVRISYAVFCLKKKKIKRSVYVT